jgi:N-acetylmuramoyl-L-alanine amidase
MQKIAMSSGHGKLVQGASGYINEVEEARRVANRVATLLNNIGMDVFVFHDDTSTSQNENLNRIVDWHNKQTRELDVSFHFNAYQTTSKPMGVEVLYVTKSDLAQKVATKIAGASGLINRGPKKRTDLFFLNNTEEPAILIEVCFVDSEADVNLYHDHFESICLAIVEAVTGISQPPIETEPPPATEGSFSVTGKVSYFGGPDDEGVSRTEGLAFISSIEQAPHLFLPYQPAGTTGLARRLNPHVHYVACRWDYEKISKADLLNTVVLVRAPKTGIALRAFPGDWGPAEGTNRVADLSPSLMQDLGIQTDDTVEVICPAPEADV